MNGEPNAIVSLTSNGAFADSLFCGHKLGNASLLDLQTLKTVRTFDPLRSILPCYPSQTEWSRDPVHSIALLHSSLRRARSRVLRVHPRALRLRGAGRVPSVVQHAAFHGV